MIAQNIVRYKSRIAPNPVEHRWLYLSDEIKIAIFHDGWQVIPDLVRLGLLDEKTFIYIGMSWCGNGYRWREINQMIEKTSSEFNFPQLRDHIILMMNSRYELQIARSIIRGSELLLFNNNAVINPNLYPIHEDDTKSYDAIMVARAIAYKRHYLATRVKSVVYVATDVKTGSGITAPIDIAALNPTLYVKNLEHNDLVSLINRCHVGLLLSDTEGACYASTEYMLCGLPVVSTPSFGGRDEYYDDYCAVICPANEHDVVFSVNAMIERVKSGEIHAAEIRSRCVRRTEAFRATLASSLDAKAAGMGLTVPLGRVLLQRLDEDNRLWRTMNWWPLEVIV